MTWDVWAVLLGYCAFALILMVVVPGPEVHGPMTPKGNIPVYKDNGCRCYVLTLISFAALTYVLYVNGLTPTVVYDKLAGYLLATNILGHIICIYLLWKGINNPTIQSLWSSDCLYLSTADRCTEYGPICWWPASSQLAYRKPRSASVR